MLTIHTQYTNNKMFCFSVAIRIVLVNEDDLTLTASVDRHTLWIIRWTNRAFPSPWLQV